jgi:hypothetical protein
MHKEVVITEVVDSMVAVVTLVGIMVDMVEDTVAVIITEVIEAATIIMVVIIIMVGAGHGDIELQEYGLMGIGFIIHTILILHLIGLTDIGDLIKLDLMDY